MPADLVVKAGAAAPVAFQAISFPVAVEFKLICPDVVDQAVVLVLIDVSEYVLAAAT